MWEEREREKRGRRTTKKRGWDNEEEREEGCEKMVDKAVALFNCVECVELYISPAAGRHRD